MIVKAADKFSYMQILIRCSEISTCSLSLDYVHENLVNAQAWSATCTRVAKWPREDPHGEVGEARRTNDQAYVLSDNSVTS